MIGDDNEEDEALRVFMECVSRLGIDTLPMP